MPLCVCLNLSIVFMLRLLVLVALVAACATAQKSSPIAAETVQRGRAQFQRSCAFCHGANGDGGSEGPSLIRSALVRHDEKGDLIVPVIQEGRPDRGMPSIPLTTGQSSEVVAFLHDRLKTLDRTSPGRPSADRYGLALLLTGNAEEGRAYFNGAGGCSGCHSPERDLAGIAKKYSPVDLQTRFLYPTGKPVRATVILASGKQWEGKVIRQDSFSIAIEDSEGWYHSWTLPGVKVEAHDPLAAHKALLQSMTNSRMHNLFAYLETLK